jgi:hypothetical protein
MRGFANAWQTTTALSLAAALVSSTACTRHGRTDNDPQVSSRVQPAGSGALGDSSATPTATAIEGTDAPTVATSVPPGDYLLPRAPHVNINVKPQIAVCGTMLCGVRGDGRVDCRGPLSFPAISVPPGVFDGATEAEQSKTRTFTLWDVEDAVQLACGSQESMCVRTDKGRVACSRVSDHAIPH